MKKINSNGYAHIIIGWAFLFLAIIPLSCYFLDLIFHFYIFFFLLRTSFIIGFIIILFFVGLLIIEFHQDKRITQQYSIIKITKLVLKNGCYECQCCGNKQVGDLDKECRICGVKFMMNGKQDNKGFWNSYAKLYDLEIKHFNGNAYTEMYRMMRSSLSSDMNVLEVATGTGLIALGISDFVRSVEATDFSPKMIEAAMKKKTPSNVRFSIEDATALSFQDAAFDAAVISNALHIMPDPEKALSEISRVLKPKGLLIAPTYSHGHLRESTWNLNAKILRFIGFETYSKWSPDEYINFISQNGFNIEKTTMLKAAFPLVYLEARKQ